MTADALTRYSETLNIPSPELALQALARAIASTPTWASSVNTLLLVAPESLRLAVIGPDDPVLRTSLQAQTRDLNDACANLRWIDYPRVNLACQRLAQQLAQTLGEDALRRAHFVAIPRGGLVVLGILASALGITREQLSRPESPDEPLVVVDDCAISGARFADFLQGCPSRQILFVHLFSHPSLRTTILAREPRVVACLSAEDLDEHGLYGQPEGWRERWASLVSWKAYWYGRPQPLGFPWNEPDRMVWNPMRQQTETAWRLVPPESCLKNRPQLGPTPLPVQVQPQAPGPIRPHPDVLFGDLGAQTLLAHLTTGECFRLSGTSRDMWHELMAHGTLSQAATALQAKYDVPKATLHRDLSAWFERLVARRLVQRPANQPAD